MDIVKSAKENPLQTIVAGLILASISGGGGAVTSLLTPSTETREHSSLDREVVDLRREIDKLDRSIADEARDRRQALFNQRQEFLGFLMRYSSVSSSGGGATPSMIELLETLAPAAADAMAEEAPAETPPEE